MLSPQDLKAIGRVVEEAFDRKFDAAFDRKFDAAFDRKFDEKMNPILEAINERFDLLENTLVTKAYLDEKLAFYVKKPF